VGYYKLHQTTSGYQISSWSSQLDVLQEKKKKPSSYIYIYINKIPVIINSTTHYIYLYIYRTTVLNFCEMVKHPPRKLPVLWGLWYNQPTVFFYSDFFHILRTAKSKNHPTLIIRSFYNSYCLFRPENSLVHKIVNNLCYSNLWIISQLVCEHDNANKCTNILR
jgi:hypothetical protein